jgi:pilus assembly protein CpaD
LNNADEFRRNDMTKTIFLIAAICSLGLTGCGAVGTNTGMYSINQPVVARTNYMLDVNLGGGNSFATGEMQRVTEWLDGLQIGYGDRIAVDYGDGYNNAFTQGAVNNFAADYGLKVVDTAPVTPGMVAAGTIRIVVTRSTASVPNCPNWSKTTEANYNASVHPNYGCAVNSTMAAMIADPEDLVRGKKDENLDRTSGSEAIKKYRSKLREPANERTFQIC